MKEQKKKLDIHLKVLIDKLSDFFSCEVNLNEEPKNISSQDFISYELKHNNELYTISFVRKDIGKTTSVRLLNRYLF